MLSNANSKQRWRTKENQNLTMADTTHLSGNWLNLSHWLDGYLKRPYTSCRMLFFFSSFEHMIRPKYQTIRNLFYKRLLKSIQLSVSSVHWPHQDTASFSLCYTQYTWAGKVNKSYAKPVISSIFQIIIIHF